MGEASGIGIIVFDFDGTLVDSNGPKHRAFYELFPDEDAHRSAISAVLDECAEESRYVILEKILNRLGGGSPGARGAGVGELADRYDELALSAAAECPEKSGASSALSGLGRRYTLYLSSGTPVESLKTLVAERGWTHHFKDIFGYPAGKPESLRTIMQRDNCPETRILVVGDGESDRRAAEVTGCGFFPVDGDDALARLVELLLPAQECHDPDKDI